MTINEAVGMFALGALFGCILAAIAIDKFALRALRQSTKELRTARMIYRAATKAIEE